MGLRKKCLICLVLLITLCLAGCGDKNEGPYVVGILEDGDHPAFTESTEAFKTGLLETFGEETVSFLYYDLQENEETAKTAAEDFVMQEVDLILANGPVALVAAANATKDIPVLGCSITEYKSLLGLEKFTGTIGGNISGTSALASLDEQAEIINRWMPVARKVALLYCSDDPASVNQVDTMKRELGKLGITSILYPFTDAGDLPAVCAAAVSGCDALYLPIDTAIADNATIISNISVSAAVPVFGGDPMTCSLCSLATSASSYKDLGKSTAEMAARVLTGNANISKMPVEYVKPVKMYNNILCDWFNVTPLEGYLPITEK